MSFQGGGPLSTAINIRLRLECAWGVSVNAGFRTLGTALGASLTASHHFTLSGSTRRHSILGTYVIMHCLLSIPHVSKGPVLAQAAVTDTID